MAFAAGATTEKTPRDRAGSDRLVALVGNDLTAVNAAILARMDSPVALIPQLAGHIIAAGGKRLRPMLTLASARLCGYQGQRHIPLAACVEFIHTATLLHDDVVDDSGLRRGLATATAVWGNKASVLVGDFLFSRAFQLMVEDGSLKILKILSDASAIIAEGEVQQLMTANDTSTDEATYLDVIRAKTAALFAAACQVGAVVAERPDAEEEALRRFGLNFGMAFQLIDDVLDYNADQGELGKAVGDDFRDGKVTLPVVLAFARGDESERGFWRRCIEEQDHGDADLEEALALMERHDALADAMERARSYGRAALENLDSFAESAIKAALAETLEQSLRRIS